MWTHAKWKKELFSRISAPDLQQYSGLFTSVEGNTSFYHLPDERAILGWKELVPANFRFTFKFPQQISHHKNILAEPDLLRLTLDRFALMEEKLGVLMLQLPASFGPTRLDELSQFFRALPADFNYAVEVRNQAFFAKGEDERQFNRLLHQHNVNRVIMDTRGLFSCDNSNDPLLLDVQTKKPKVPTNVLATASHPIVRFVGHPVIEDNDRFLTPWIHKVQQWRTSGIQPYLFFHMPDNAYAPWLVQRFFEQYRRHYPEAELPNFTLPDQQRSQLNLLE